MLTLLTACFWILLGLMVLLLAWIAILLGIMLRDPNKVKQEKHNAWLWKALARKKTGWPNSNAG